MTLTKTQKKYYNYIKKFIQRNGYSPTEREIQKHFKRAPVTVRGALTILQKKGYISRIPKKARTITLIGEKNV